MTVRAALILAAIPMTIGGCEKEAHAEPLREPDGCEAFYDRTAACLPDMVDGVPRDDVVGMCRTIAQDKGPDSLFVNQLKCAQQYTDCAGFEACADRAKLKWEQRLAEETAIEISRAVETRDLNRAQALCRVDPQPTAVATQCRRVMDVRWDELVLQMTILRDNGRDGGATLCRELRQLSRKRSGTAEARADVLCRETQAAIAVRTAIEAALKNTRESVPLIPDECSRAAGETRRLASEWGARKHAEVVDACYVRLGRVVLEKRQKETWCSRHVRTVLKILDSGPVRDLDLDALSGPARRVCRM